MYIRLAEKKDVTNIMQFINHYWKKGHILATNRELFEWQYITNDQVNIVIGIDENEVIQGILGFIPYSNDKKKDIALALWKANHAKTFLGIQLLLFLIKEVPHRHIICTGINLQTTEKIYKKLGMKVDTMIHWYRLNAKMKYQIAKINNNYIPSYTNLQYELIPISTFEPILTLLKNNQTVPYKSREYLYKRYFDHPCYRYLLYGVKSNNNISMIIILRLQEYNSHNVLRLIDCIGDVSQMIYVTKAIDQLLIEFNTEYIDMYEAGVPNELLLKAGWLTVKESNNIIPNYFSPYLQTNVDIHYCTSKENAILFKGDGDQDRPN